MKDIAQEEDEIEMIGNGLNRTMQSILKVEIQTKNASNIPTSNTSERGN